MLTERDSDFAFLAHDLSQLLWAIQGRAHALAARLGDQAGAAQAIAEDAAAAAAMLADRTGSAADPVAVANAAWRQTVDRATARGESTAAISFSGPEAAPWVAAPPHALRRILANLFANAVEVMPDGGGIAWTAAGSNDLVQLVVTDSGPGVAPELHDRLFDVGATAGKPGGHGLGLAGSRALARAHGGDLELGAGDGGAVFIVTLPLAPAPAAVEEALDAVTPLRLLVVDDELPVRDMLTELLACEGHAATVVGDATAALAEQDRGHYDAALIDLGLPGISGPDLARSLRSRDASLIVAMLTGWGREEELARLDPTLVDLTAVKPLDLPQLRELLAGAARLARARRQPKTEE